MTETLSVRDMSNENHPRWKGDNAKKITLHIWLAKNKPKPKVCEKCKKERKLSLANIKNHNYTRNIEDYQWLCYSCHKKMDMGDYCKKGHKLDGVDSRGKRFCSICKKVYAEKYRKKKRAGDALINSPLRQGKNKEPSAMKGGSNDVCECGHKERLHRTYPIKHNKDGSMEVVQVPLKNTKCHARWMGESGYCNCECKQFKRAKA